MPLRYYMDFPSLRGESLRVEIHDADFVGTALEMDGDDRGFEIDWGGNGAFEAGPLPSSMSLRFLHNGTSTPDTFVSAIVGAREGRFHLVAKRDGVAHPFYLVADQFGLPDEALNFHLDFFGVDGMARLKDLDYVDATTGDPYTGRATVVEHLFNIIEHIGLTSVTTLATHLLNTTGHWYEDGMDSTTCPYKQVTIDHERFLSKDREGNTIPWTCWDVLESICQQFFCRFFFAEAGYHFQQIELYEDATQKVYHYNASGSHVATTAAQDFDVDIDYTDATGGRKLAGGRTTYLQAVNEVKVRYNHLTLRNLANGLTFPASGGPFNLPGSIPVPNANETYARFVFRFSILPTWNLSGNMPTLRFNFKITLRIGSTVHTLKRVRTSNYAQPNEFLAAPVYSSPTWATSGADQDFDHVSPIFVPSQEGFTSYHTLEFITPYLPTAVDGDTFELDIEEVNAIDIDNGTYLNGAGLSWDWQVADPAVYLYNDGLAQLTDEGVVEFTASDGTGGNTLTLEVDTFYGDGPNVLSLGKLQLAGGSTDTNAWQVGGTGTSYDLNKLLALRMLALRVKPVEVFQVTWMKEEIYPYSRLTDTGSGKNYMCVRATYSSKYDQWQGEFVKVSRDVTGIVLTGPTAVSNPVGNPAGDPPPPTVPPEVPGESQSEGLAANPNTFGVMAPAQTDGSQTAADINATTPNQITIGAVNYAFLKAGDKFRLVNPVTGTSQLLTVANTYQPNATTLDVTEDVTDDYPNGSLIVPTGEVLLRGRGFAHKEWAFTGTEVTVPTTLGYLPNPGSVTEAEIDRRVEVYAGGVRHLYSSTERAGCFRILAEFNKIKFWDKQRAADVLVVVR